MVPTCSSPDDRHAILRYRCMMMRVDSVQWCQFPSIPQVFFAHDSTSDELSKFVM